MPAEHIRSCLYFSGCSGSRKLQVVTILGGRLFSFLYFPVEGSHLVIEEVSKYSKTDYRHDSIKCNFFENYMFDVVTVQSDEKLLPGLEERSFK